MDIAHPLSLGPSIVSVRILAWFDGPIEVVSAQSFDWELIHIDDGGVDRDSVCLGNKGSSVRGMNSHGSSNLFPSSDNLPPVHYLKRRTIRL